MLCARGLECAGERYLGKMGLKIAVYHNLLSGGNKRALYETVRGFKQNRHEVHVYNLSISEEEFAPLDEIADRINTTPVYNPANRGPLKLLLPLLQIIQLVSVWRANYQIAQTINGGDYDVVWISNCYVTQHPILTRYLEKPHVLYSAEHFRLYCDPVSREYFSRASGYKGLLRRLYECYVNISISAKALVDRKSIRKAKAVLVNSYFTKENILRSYSVVSLPLYLGVDLERYRPRKVAKENMILSVGGLTPLKGHELVLASLVHLPIGIRPRLVIVADRVDSRTAKQSYERFAAQHSIDLEIKTGITDQAVLDLYARAKVTVCANILEPFGLVPIESMACGTPVVAVKEGGFRETIVDGKTGIHVERDERALASAIKRLLGDDGFRESLGENAYRWVEKQFGLDRYWSALEVQIQSVAASGQLSWTEGSSVHRDTR